MLYSMLMHKGGIRPVHADYDSKFRTGQGVFRLVVPDEHAYNDFP